MLPRVLQLYRSHQQDAVQNWVAGTDGSVYYRQEHRGLDLQSGWSQLYRWNYLHQWEDPFQLFVQRLPGFHALLLKAPPAVNLLVFIDFLTLLIFLKLWSCSDFWAGPGDLAHFDVIILILVLLRSPSGQTALIKIKSHSGCLLNELADERAGLGGISKDRVLCLDPSKFCSLRLSD